jgi:carboxypeptidase family protein
MMTMTKKMMMTTMMTMTTKRAAMMRKSQLKFSFSAAHLVRQSRHHTLSSAVVLICFASAAVFACHASALGNSVGASAAQKRPSPDDGILYVTVFTEKGARLPDASYTAHPFGKTKPHWEGFSDVRGEFAVRVSLQGDYEIVVNAKGYNPQTRKVTSEAGDKTDVVFNLIPKTQKKP